jgi:hypothetical protein
VSRVSTLAAVADESPAFGRRQLCIDLLCGYLRLPYDPDSGDNHLTEFVSTTTWSAAPPATHIEEQRRQAIRQNDREVRNTIVRMVARHLQATADTSWSRHDFDFAGVLFEGAALAGATFSGRHVSFEGATFGAKATSFDGATLGGTSVAFDDARFAGEYVSFDRVSFAAEKTTFLSAKFKCLRASFDSPAEWKNVEFDWDTANVAGDSLPTIPRCITPRPWPPNLTGEA